MRIFLTGPLTSKCINRRMNEADIERLERVIKFMENKGHSVFNSHKLEKFGKELRGSECTKADFEEVEKCDILIAYPGSDMPSVGVGIELGWGSALNKKIVLLLKKSKEYSTILPGLKDLTSTEVIEFENDEEVFEKLDKLL